jgi:hypothetical protein
LALDLPTAPRVNVFRAIESMIRNDPTISRTVKPESLRAWSGATADAKNFTIEHSPAIRLTPTSGPEQFYTPDSMSGDLIINVEMLVKGSNADDIANLWYALERVFYPAASSDKFKRVAALQAAGATTGLLLFSVPAFDSDPDGVFMAAAGQMRITVDVRLNT